MDVETSENALRPIAFRVRCTAGHAYGRVQGAILLIEPEGLTLERSRFSMLFASGLPARLIDTGRHRTIYQLARRAPGWSAYMLVSEGTGFRVVGFKNHQLEPIVSALESRGFTVRFEVVPTRFWLSLGYFVDFLRKTGKLSPDMEEV